MKDVILHLDGDAFFASVEQALDPALKGRPVMTGAERGIVAAFSYEAKARGISRGMQTWKAKEVCPELIVRSSDYRLYQIFARRAAAIMRRHVPLVEEYGIDECFAAIPGGTLEAGAVAARNIQADLLRELDVSYSIGVAPTKSLAKAGSKWQKPCGITVVDEAFRQQMLREIPVGKLWGIGRRMAPRLMSQGIHTAHDLAAQDELWVARHLAKPYLCMWAELRGIPALSFGGNGREQRGSVQKTRTFWPSSSEHHIVWAELLHNIEKACAKLRSEQLLARGISIFVKNTNFAYRKGAVTLAVPTAFPEEIVAAITPVFERIFRSDEKYRATGVTLWETAPHDYPQKPLFGNPSPANPELDTLWKTLDQINAKDRKIWLGTSKPSRPRKRMFRIPLLGGSAR